MADDNIITEELNELVSSFWAVSIVANDAQQTKQAEEIKRRIEDRRAKLQSRSKLSDKSLVCLDKFIAWRWRGTNRNL